MVHAHLGKNAGNYTVKAQAGFLPNEYNTTDNNTLMMGSSTSRF